MRQNTFQNFCLNHCILLCSVIPPPPQHPPSVLGEQRGGKGGGGPGRTPVLRRHAKFHLLGQLNVIRQNVHSARRCPLPFSALERRMIKGSHQLRVK
jgi:hypothetical protein